MARAHNVFVVTEGGLPVGAFTVKHELASWLRKEWDKLDRLYVWRMPDGGRVGAKSWPAMYFYDKEA